LHRQSLNRDAWHQRLHSRFCGMRETAMNHEGQRPEIQNDENRTIVRRAC
jgi:hypothetical protein